MANRITNAMAIDMANASKAATPFVTVQNMAPTQPNPSSSTYVGLWLLVVCKSKHHHQSVTRELMMSGATE